LPLRDRVADVVAAPRFQRLVITVIVLNAATLGLETWSAAVDRFGPVLTFVDRAALYFFVAELGAKIYVFRSRFFRDPWNLFDLFVVGISLMPTTGGLAVLRALRILRALRLISAVPSLRRVVAALLGAVPGMASIAILLALVLYVAAVMGTKLYGRTAPDHFGDLPTSLFTLFQTMTGEAWPDIARDVMEEHPTAWIFFVIFILICTFVVLNLFIAVVVSAMEEEQMEERAELAHAAEDAARDANQAILAEFAALRGELAALRGAVLTGSPAVGTAERAVAESTPTEPTPMEPTPTERPTTERAAESAAAGAADARAEEVTAEPASSAGPGVP
jgi:voltage-gated sodium channel